MMKRRTLLICGAVLSAAALAGGLAIRAKSMPKRTYELHVGGKVFQLPVYENPHRIQDDIIAHVKPVWDRLGDGTSAEFYFRCVVPQRVSREWKRKVKRKFGSSASLTTTWTVISARYRFFKGRHPVDKALKGAGLINGVEQVQKGVPPLPECYGASVDWDLMENYLREAIFSAKRIHWEIQKPIG